MKKSLLISLGCTAIFFNTLPNLYAQAIQRTLEYQNAMKALGEGDYEKAYETISPLIQKDKYRGAALYEMGKIRNRQAEAEMSIAINHFNEAADYMNSGLTSNGVNGSEVPKAMFDLATLYQEKLKDYTSAIDIYSKIIDNYPTYLAIDKVYYNLAACEESNGMLDEAVSHYHKVVSEYPYSTFFAVAKEKTRKLAKGTKSADAVMETQEQFAEEASNTSEGGKANLDLGDMQAQSGKYKQAANSYRQAIRDASTQEEGVEAYRKLISMLDEKQKDYKAAAEAIEEMLEAYPNASGNEDMVYKLGQIYENDMDSLKKQIVDGQVRYRKSDESSRKAIEYYDSVTSKYPDSNVAADAYIHKGKLYEELKEYAEARAEYESFIKDFPNHSEAQNIKRKIKELRDY